MEHIPSPIKYSPYRKDTLRSDRVNENYGTDRRHTVTPHGIFNSAITVVFYDSDEWSLKKK